MSFSTVVPYFQARLNALGFTEWKEPFTDDNIPANILEGSYQIQVQSAAEVKQNQTALEYLVPVQLRIHFKGFKEPWLARNKAMLKAESICQECLAHANRLTQAGIKNIYSTAFAAEALSDSNDNIVRLTMDFQALVLIEIN